MKKKIKSVVNFPQPKNQRELKGFLGLTGFYRKFIKNYSQIAKPLTALLKNDVVFLWNDKCQKAFSTMKEILTSEPILQYPNVEEMFILTCDASGQAIGSVLSQMSAGKNLPIAYASRVLNSAEQRYSTTESECLAIAWSVKHFRPYLWGAKFRVVTDHKPLTWLFNVKDPGSRLIRWRLKLEEYDYEIVCKKGTENQNADAFSRILIAANEEEITYNTFNQVFASKKIVNKNIEEVKGTLLEAGEDYHIGLPVTGDLSI